MLRIIITKRCQQKKKIKELEEEPATIKTTIKATSSSRKRQTMLIYIYIIMFFKLTVMITLIAV